MWQTLSKSDFTITPDIPSSRPMGEIKDIIDLVIGLEKNVKERRDIEVLQKILSLASSLQADHLNVVERDIRLMEENSSLKRQLAEAVDSDLIRIHHAIEFRKGKRTGGKWLPFCPKCHLPAIGMPEDDYDEARALCSASCGWTVPLEGSITDLSRQLD